MERDLRESAKPERREAVVALQPSELALDSGAAAEQDQGGGFEPPGPFQTHRIISPARSATPAPLCAPEPKLRRRGV
jgi:hypothetical protein